MELKDEFGMEIRFQLGDVCILKEEALDKLDNFKLSSVFKEIYIITY